MCGVIRYRFIPRLEKMLRCWHIFSCHKVENDKSQFSQKNCTSQSNMSHRQESCNQHTFFKSTNDYIDKYNIVFFKTILQKLTFRKGQLHQLKGEIFITRNLSRITRPGGVNKVLHAANLCLNKVFHAANLWTVLLSRCCCFTIQVYLQMF